MSGVTPDEQIRRLNEEVDAWYAERREILLRVKRQRAFSQILIVTVAGVALLSMLVS